MIPFELPLTIVKGISYGPVTFHFKQADGDFFDLTNWSVFSYARKTHNAKEKIDLTPHITNAVEGIVVIEMTDEATATLTGGIYGYDMVLQDPAGARLGPFFAGKLKIAEIYSHT